MEEVEESVLNDPRVFQALVAPLRDAMLGLARRYMRAEDAEDVVQVALLRAFDKRDTFAVPDGADPAATLRSWLLRITYRVFATASRGDLISGLRIRSLGAHEVPIRDAIPGGAVTSDADFYDVGSMMLADDQPEHEFERGSRYSAAVEEALLALPVDFRRIVLLVEEGYTYQQVAKVMGVPVGTVMSRLSRARAVLRDVLGPYAFFEWGLVCDTRKNAPRGRAAVTAKARHSVGVVVIRRRCS